MASDLFVFSSPELVSSDCDNLLFPDPLFDSSIDHFHGGLDCVDPLYNSPPSQQLENLSLCQTQFQTLSSDFENACGNFNAFDLKTEEAQLGLDCFENYMQFMPHSYDDSEENAAKYMQRTYSGNSFDVVYDHNNNNNYGGSGLDNIYQTQIGNVMDSPKFQLNSPENMFLARQLRRVCSTGDIHKSGVEYTRQRSVSSPLATEGGFTEDGSLKAGRYSAEERKERISKYRAKRRQRNFTKTIKYACRKTLADNRPRIRGRFARNDEYVETPNSKPASSQEDDDDLWFEGLQEKDENLATTSNVNFVNGYGQSQQFSHCGFLFDREF